MYQVRNGRMGKPLNFRLCDTKGLEKDDGIDPHEFCYILDGNMPDKYMVMKILNLIKYLFSTFLKYMFLFQYQYPTCILHF